MDDISEKLAELLNDPESFNRVREMAENILGSNKREEPQSMPTDTGNLFVDGIDPAQLGKIMSILTRLKSNHNDNRERLLLALKPHLSAPRCEKIDVAIKLLKLIDLLPYLKDSGIFEF